MLIMLLIVCKSKTFFDDCFLYACSWLHLTHVLLCCHVTVENGEQSNALKMVCFLLLVIVFELKK